MTGEPCNSWLMYSLRHVLFRIIGWWKLSSLTGHCCLMWNACFVECAHSRNVALSSWLSCSGSCNESIQCSFLTEMWTETLFGTFTTIYGVAWVFSCRAGLLPSKTGFRKLYGDGLSQRLCEKRCNWLEREKKVSLFTDCNLQGLQLAALVEMRPPIPPPGLHLPAEHLPCKREQLCYYSSCTCTINLMTEPHCFQKKKKNQYASHQ